MSDQATGEDLQQPEPPNYEKVCRDLQKAIDVTAAKSDVDRLTVILADLKSLVYPAEPSYEPEPAPDEPQGGV